jgi:hypothetical protein
LHVVREGFVSGSDLSFERGLERNGMYVEQSHYALHLRRWLEHFPREQLFVVFQEDLDSQPDIILRDLYRFLDIDLRFTPVVADRRANASSVPRSAVVETALKNGGRLARAVGLGAAVRRIKSMPGVYRMRQANRVDLRAMVPPMRTSTRQRLVDEFAAGVDDLRQLLGREHLPWPAFERVVGHRTVVADADPEPASTVEEGNR